MKKILIILGYLCFGIVLFSVPQDLTTARRIADNFLQSKGQNLRFSETITLHQNNITNCYIFKYNPDTFVAVSADNDVFPLIAYSFRNSIPVSGSFFSQMLNDDIALRKKYYRMNPTSAEDNHMIWDRYSEGNISSREFQQWPAEGNTITDGWLETRWNQNGVYDDFCPIDNSGERSNAGCVATAMAQIVNFHKFIGDPIITFSNSDDYYAGGGIDIDDDYSSRDFPTFSQLNGYLTDLWNHYEFDVELTDADKAALSFACGVAVEMQFSSTGSSASTNAVGYNLRNKFDFNDAFYYSYSGSFFDNLQEDMLEMRPAQLSINNPEVQIGHSIVCDGYNTDGYFHLNMGWGISNETSWYLLPSEIPDGYSIVNGGVLDIEGGAVPVNVTGNVAIVGTSAPGTYITLQGEKFYESYVALYSGDFEFPAVEEGNYIATAFLSEDRDYYQSYETYIDEDNNVLQFDLAHFEGVTGNVTATVSSENANVTFYQDNVLISSGTADENGDYFVPNVLPGDYTAIAGVSGNYYEQKDVTITAEHQTEDFELMDYPGNIAVSHSNHPVETWNFVPNFTLTCAAKFTAEELGGFDDMIISKVRFKAPMNADEGELFVQVWIEDYLISETPVSDFSYGYWTEVEINNPIPVNWSNEFFIGYKVQSTTGEFAFHDSGPRVVGKGAFYRNTGWTELPDQDDYNFCIDAVLTTQEFGSVTGNVQVSGSTSNVTDSVVKAGKFCSHPNQEGNYQLDILSGNYDLTASLFECVPVTISDVEVLNEQITEDVDFVLNSVSGTEELLPNIENFLDVYPNPFNPSTTINFSLTHSGQVEIVIYNVKGQKVRTLIDCMMSPGNSRVIWNGMDEENRKASSGTYFVKLIVNKVEHDVRKVTVVK
jgi:hypothetical protein